MKAWMVTIKDSDESEFVLAETRGKAKYYSDTASWGDWIELRVRRIPELDGIEHPTDWDWYSRVKGWAYGFTCRECCDSIDMDDDKFVFDEGGWIYHESCLEEVTQEWESTCDYFHEVMGRCEADGLSLHTIREIMEDIEGA